MTFAAHAHAATRLPVADPVWFFGLTTWIRAGGDTTDGTFSVVEQEIPVGFASPWHVHHQEHEAFLILDGQAEVTVGDTTAILGQGAFGWGPRGVPHGFRITGDRTARLILMTTGPRFAEFARELGQPYSETPPPPPGPEAIPMLMALAERHGMTIFGPMPD